MGNSEITIANVSSQVDSEDRPYAYTPYGEVQRVTLINKSTFEKMERLACWLCVEERCHQLQPGWLSSEAIIDRQIDSRGYCDECLNMAGRITWGVYCEL